MKRVSTLLVFALLFALPALSACGAAEPPAQTSVAAEITDTPLLSLGGCSVRADAAVLDLSGRDFSPALLIENAPLLTSLSELRLGVTALSGDELQALCAAFPGVDIRWQLAFNDSVVDSDAETLDLSALRAEQLAEAAALLRRLPSLRTVELRPAEGCTRLTPFEVQQLADAAPEARFLCRFELFGQTADGDTRELRYADQPLGDACIPLLRAALPFLPSLELLRLQDCAIEDNDAMAALRDDFPAVKIVWSIRIAGFRFMTDTTLVNAAPILTDENVALLRYMNDVLYLDVGHNRSLTSLEFVRHFPRLQVAIFSITRITDLSPLADCPELEYLELISTDASDLSPLSGLTKLRYLNLGYMRNLTDLSPLYDMKELTQVRICGTTFAHISQADVDRLQEELPDTFVSASGGSATHAGLWRFQADGTYTERYALLREQMRYDIIDWMQRLSNSPSGEER